MTENRETLFQLRRRDRIDADVQEFVQLSSESGGRSRGWRFDRDELHERSDVLGHTRQISGLRIVNPFADV